MKWMYTSLEKWNNHILPKTQYCKYCFRPQKRPVFYLFDGYKGVFDSNICNESFCDLRLIFKHWLDLPILELYALAKCQKCGHNVEILTISYTPTEKEMLRNFALPEIRYIDGGTRVINLLLPRGLKKVKGKLEFVF